MQYQLIGFVSNILSFDFGCQIIRHLGMKWVGGGRNISMHQMQMEMAFSILLSSMSEFILVQSANVFFPFITVSNVCYMLLSSWMLILSDDVGDGL